MEWKGKVLLIGAENEENLAIRYLGAVLEKKGHIVKISGFSNESDTKSILNEIKSFNPDLIGISIAFQSLAKDYFNLIKKIKETNKKVHITVGGHFPTFEYKKILETQKDIDSVIRYEGETPIIQLTEALIKKDEFSKINNIVYRKDNIIIENPRITKFQVLDELPFPLRTKKTHKRLGENFATLVSSRGCFHSSCLYCCIGAFHSKKEGEKYALRTPKNIAKEISNLYHNKKVKLFQFHDDNFMLPNKEETIKRFKELKQELENEKINIKEIAFLIKARPDSINKEVADTLYDLGIVGIFLGIENATDTGLKSLIRGSTLKDIENAINILKKYPIAITFNLLIFHPNATLNEIKENLIFIKKNICCAMDFGRAEIVAGSPLEKQVINEKLIKGEWPNWNYSIKDPVVEKFFLVNKMTFRRKDSIYPKLAHSLIALSYNAYIINRLYPGLVSKKILSETIDLIKNANEFILKFIVEVYNLSKIIKTNKDSDELFNKINDKSRELIKESEILTKRMNRLQIIEKNFRLMDIKESPQNMKFITKIFRI